MAYSLIISEKAIADAITAINYYDSISMALGNRFAEELGEAYDKIAANPELYSYISSNPVDKLRDIKLRSFPYLVIYQVVSNDVYVNSIFNTSQDPLRIK